MGLTHCSEHFTRTITTRLFSRPLPSAAAEPEQFVRLHKAATRLLRRLQAANDGYLHAVDALLQEAYGLRGYRKHTFLAVRLSPATVCAGKKDSLTRGTAVRGARMGPSDAPPSSDRLADVCDLSQQASQLSLCALEATDAPASRRARLRSGEAARSLAERKTSGHHQALRQESARWDQRAFASRAQRSASFCRRERRRARASEDTPQAARRAPREALLARMARPRHHDSQQLSLRRRLGKHEHARATGPFRPERLEYPRSARGGHQSPGRPETERAALCSLKDARGGHSAPSTAQAPSLERALSRPCDIRHRGRLRVPEARQALGQEHQVGSPAREFCSVLATEAPRLAPTCARARR